MFKFLKDRKKKDNKGFTLVELVIVVAILAILVGLLAPQYTKYVERSRKAADASNLDSMVTAVKVATADQQYSAIIPASGTIDVVITMTKDISCLFFYFFPGFLVPFLLQLIVLCFYFRVQIHILFNRVTLHEGVRHKISHSTP